ncbi:hypothetical protein CAK78_19700 [Aeromonas sp. A35_P]|nr:hypothetical protein CAK78_19700 [Aeromonas sp. A35_P]
MIANTGEGPGEGVSGVCMLTLSGVVTLWLAGRGERDVPGNATREGCELGGRRKRRRLHRGGVLLRG